MASLLKIVSSKAAGRSGRAVAVAQTGGQRGRRRKKHRRRSGFHPPNPELSEQFFSRVGYVEDFFETRTKLGAYFSNRLEVADGALKNRNLRHCIAGGFQFCADLLFEVGGIPDTVDQEVEKPFDGK